MIKIGICGFGYRAHFYLEIAKATKEFLVVGIYTTSEEERKQIALDGYLSISDPSEFKELNPLFIVNAISKDKAYDLTTKLLAMGFYVLQETPYATCLDNIKKSRINNHLQIAEQYNLSPSIKAYKKIIESNLIGEVSEIKLSMMHDYHAYSVIRYLLDTKGEARISGFKYTDNVCRTKTRSAEYTDGVIIAAKKKHIFLRYPNNKKAIYDFNSEEYRSPIRNKHIHILGTRGEIFDDKIYYLDNSNNAKVETIKIEYLKNQVTKISIGKEILFRDTNIYGFNEDMYALYSYLKQMPNFIINHEEVYPINFAKADSLASVHMNNVGDIDETS